MFGISDVRSVETTCNCRRKVTVSPANASGRRSPPPGNRDSNDSWQQRQTQRLPGMCVQSTPSPSERGQGEESWASRLRHSWPRAAHSLATTLPTQRGPSWTASLTHILISPVEHRPSGSRDNCTAPRCGAARCRTMSSSSGCARRMGSSARHGGEKLSPA
jgi:hypothetical protein